MKKWTDKIIYNEEATPIHSCKLVKGTFIVRGECTYTNELFRSHSATDINAHVKEKIIDYIRREIYSDLQHCIIMARDLSLKNFGKFGGIKEFKELQEYFSEALSIIDGEQSQEDKKDLEFKELKAELERDRIIKEGNVPGGISIPIDSDGVSNG